MSNEPMIMRVSESGPIAGDENNPPLVGGTSDPADGSKAVSRTWIYRGTPGADIQVPGSAAAGDIPGLVSAVVDLRIGYNYDFEFDCYVFWTLTDAMKANVLIKGSQDAGATFPDNLLTRTLQPCLSTQQGQRASIMMAGADFIAPGTPNVDHVKVQFQRLDANADASFEYTPGMTVLRIIEYSGT
jgi:hypothetical protein